VLPKLLINIDGGSRGNPGPAAYAYVVKNEGKIEQTKAEFIGISTNNVAEYTGLINALTLLTSLEPSDVTINMDSMLVVQQVKGIYKVKQPHLQILHAQVIQLLSALKTKGFQLTIAHVYREQNAIPDKLLNDCLDLHGKR